MDPSGIADHFCRPPHTQFMSAVTELRRNPAPASPFARKLIKGEFFNTPWGMFLPLTVPESTDTPQNRGQKRSSLVAALIQ
ncbi:MAG: hypothetical protein ABSF23_04315 [Terracidiphilus sp.]|jgi:hypothetical protein